MKKCVALVLVYIMLISCIPCAYATEIVNAEITDVKFKTTVNAGEAVEVLVSYIEGDSNIVSGEITFTSVEFPEKEIFCDLSTSLDDDYLHGTVSLDEYYPAGRYELTWIIIWDTNGNGVGSEIGNFTIQNEISEKFNGLGFTYLNDIEADTTAPEITTVSLNDTSFNAGDELIISIDFIETGSGFDGAAAHFINMDTMTEAFQIYPILPDGESSAKGYYVLPASLTSGNYLLSYIAISDKADNNGVLDVRMPFQSENLAGAENCIFQLTSPGTPDDNTSKINIESISLSNTTASIGDTVSAYITGDKEFGELIYRSYGNTIRFENTATNRMITAQVSNTEDPKVLKAEFEIGDKTTPGEYIIADCDIYAQKGTANFYAGRFYLYSATEASTFLSFTVNGEVPSPSGSEGMGILDTLPPRVKNINVDKPTITAPDTATISVEFEDDFSGIVSAEASFRDANDVERIITLIRTKGNSWEGFLPTTEYSAEDTFYLEYILAQDGAGNCALLGATPRQGRAILPANCRNVKITIVNSNQDAEAPILKSIIFKNESIVAPGTQEVIVDAADTVSGIAAIKVCVLKRISTNSFMGEIVNLADSFYDESSEKYERYADGMWHGFLDISEYATSQTRYLDYVYLEDNAENHKYCTSNTANEAYEEILPVASRYLCFDVINADSDGTAPTLESITFSSNDIKAPGIIEVSAKISDDLSGVKEAIACFGNYKNKGVTCSLSDVYYSEKTQSITRYEDGLWHGIIHFDQYFPSGTYYFDSISLEDFAGNVDWYYANLPSRYDNNHLPEKFKKIGITVTNPDDWSDVSTSTENSKFIEDITNSDNDAFIVVNSTNNSEVSENAFAAIKGTERTLEFISNGIKWTFDGADITNPKPVDLSFSYDTTIDTTDADGDTLNKILGNTNSVVLHFADNGILPGKATVSIKADYAMRKYLGTEGLYIYYFDKTTKQLELIASNITITDDYYIEFGIAHCSDYVITHGAVSSGDGGSHRYRGTTTPTVTSATTADMGVALYGVLSVFSLLGMGWIGKKK